MSIEIKELTVKYGDLTALNKVSLSIPKGRTIGLLGPNGSGKTTLIKTINGLLSANSGKININGHKIGVETKKLISYLPERTYLDLEMTSKQMIKFFSDFYNNFNGEKALKMIKDLNVVPTKKIKELSKGMREKVQLALVMSRDSDYYILDEPIAGVDPAARDFILETIFKYRNPKSTVIISTHLIYEISSVLDDAIILKEGNLLTYDTLKNIVGEYEDLDEWFRKEFRHA